MSKRATPAPSSEAARLRFERQRRRDTAPEMKLRRALFARGYRYRVDARVLPDVRRRVDIAFPGARVAVFVDGCYWHGCAEHGTLPKSNAEWWRAKLDANRERDKDTDRRLRDAGWTVVRVWEHEDIASASWIVEQALAK